MGVALEQGDGATAVILAGVVDISSAAELKALLLAALAAGTEIGISLDAATCLDVTAVQLLWAAGQRAQRAGARLRVSSPTAEPVSTLLVDAGFPWFPGAVVAS